MTSGNRWLWRIVPLIAVSGFCGCTLLSKDSQQRLYWNFGIVAKNMGPEERLTEVEVISGDRSFGFGIIGEKSVNRSPLPPDQPWTVVWRDPKQKLHIVRLAIDPARIPPGGDVVIEIRSPEVKVTYKEKPHHAD